MSSANVLDDLLRRHPREIGETYGEHAGHALYIGTRMIGAGFACLVHALLPGLFVRTATNLVEDIQALMTERMTPSTESRTTPSSRTTTPSSGTEIANLDESLA